MYRAQLRHEGLFVIGDWLYAPPNYCPPGTVGDAFALCCYELTFPSLDSTVTCSIKNRTQYPKQSGSYSYIYSNKDIDFLG